MKKIKIGIIFGGKSAEHEISIMSAKNIVESLDPKKYQPVLIGISKAGKWFLHRDPQLTFNLELLKLPESKHNVRLVQVKNESRLISDNGISEKLDVVFPILHGTNGEDGTIQGLLKLAEVPFVGVSVLGSAISMDKDVANRLLRDAGIPIAKFIALISNEKLTFEQAKKQLGLPMFVKPANNGSSVGVSKVKNKSQFTPALKAAFKFDNKILIEEGIDGREIECSVLGNENPVASIPGEVITSHEFYSYEAKYFDENGSRTEIPAKLSSATIKQVQKMAIEAFKVLTCEGMARVDFFLDKKGKLYINEINTIPGFTNISMYPKLWEASGLSYSKLIDKLVELAIARFKREQQLKSTL